MSEAVKTAVVLTSAIALFVVVTPLRAFAQEVATENRHAEVESSRSRRAIGYRVEGDAGGREASARQARPYRPVRRAQAFFATFPTVETLADGSRCVRLRRQAYSTEAAARSAEDTENLLWRLAAASFPLCPRTPVPANTPAAQAAEFWRVVGEDQLPSPDPDIRPGFMLAGKLAYLEAGTVPSARFENPTPAGVLTIEATAQTYVDWGDGSAVDGPFDHAGGPWPDGTITHYWTEIGHYDIRVVQRWTARWSLGAESGELAGLETVGVMNDFPVEELQAVINRG